MDATRIDRSIRTLTQATGRRAAVRSLGTSGLAMLAALRFPMSMEARKKRKQKKITRNTFGCVNVGGFCKNGGQCCSGICQGKKGKKHCQAHDARTCEAGQTIAECGGAKVQCTTSGGDPGECVTTTGNAAYCATSFDCFPCKKDVDCEPACGAGAACLPCAGACADVGSTLCAGAGGDVCDFA
jgi:hypothetical protein